jgi:predicted chitinase
VTLSQLKESARGGKPAILNAVADDWDMVEAAGIHTPFRITDFLSQRAHESDGFRTAREYADGSADEGQPSHLSFPLQSWGALHSRVH